MIASVPGLADLLALQSRSVDIDDDLDSLASSSVSSVMKKRASVRLSAVKTASYDDDEGMLSDGNEDVDEEQENEKIVKAVKQAAGKGQKKGKKAPAGTLPVQTKTTMTKKSRNPTAATASSKESRLETENRNPEPVNASRRVEYI